VIVGVGIILLVAAGLGAEAVLHEVRGALNSLR
jgi:hypothetical protein